MPWSQPASRPRVVGVVMNTLAYVDRILTAEKPADMPVQQPSRIGLRIPQSLLQRADRVVE